MGTGWGFLCLFDPVHSTLLVPKMASFEQRGGEADEETQEMDPGSPFSGAVPCFPAFLVPKRPSFSFFIAMLVDDVS